MIDLHTHSTASDGTMSPTALVRHAKERRLEAIALTDHDTVEGLEEALSAGEQEGIEVVPGIEISAEFPDSTLHILGYYMDFKNQAFLDSISVLQKARNERNPAIISKLQALGLAITLEEVTIESETGQVGRPHFAQVLLKKGYVKTPREAFEKYLGKGAPAYTDKFRFDPCDAIAHIRAAGGIPVLAHPFTIKYKTAGELEAIIADMAGWGIMGIEAYYSEHNETQVRMYKDLAEKYNLVLTGGSDFHGQNIKGISLGTGKGSLNIAYKYLEKLKARIPDALARPVSTVTAVRPG
jgi:predicted metal-dependent phosphoesterase TrpH